MSSDPTTTSNSNHGKIQSIQQKDLALLTSGQVLLDLQSAVKELVENALDAGATNIEIKFKDHGAESFQVIDNGTGIDPENYHGLALKHHTSKLQTFSDLSTVKTFGFRGEALSSLCALSQVEILTSTSTQEPIGTILTYDPSGKLLSSNGTSARKRGTTITISNLFHNLPVRRKEFEKNLKKEFQKCLNLMNCYALISKGVRWNVSNLLTKNGNKKINCLNLTSSISGNGKSGTGEGDFLNQNVVNLFGVKVNQNLTRFDLELKMENEGRMSKPTTSVRKRLQEKENREIDEKQKKIEHDRMNYSEEEDDDDDSPSDEDQHAKDDAPSSSSIRVSGLISLPTLPNGSNNSRSSSDRQFLYLNGRPWDSNKLIKTFNEVFRSFTISNSKDSSGFPFLIADFHLPGDSYDVNVSPDKRTLFVHGESELVEALKTSLEEFFAPSRSTFAIGGASKPSKNKSTSSSSNQDDPSSSPSVSQARENREEERTNLTQSKLSFQSLEDQSEETKGEKRKERTLQDEEIVNQDSSDEEDSEVQEVASEIGHSSHGKDRASPISNDLESSDSFHSTRSTSPLNRENDLDEEDDDERQDDTAQNLDSKIQDEDMEEVVIDTTKASWSPLKRNQSSTSNSHLPMASKSSPDSNPASKLKSAFKTPTLVDPSRKTGMPIERVSQPQSDKLSRGKPHRDIAELLSSFANSRPNSNRFEGGNSDRRKRAKIQEDEDEDLEVRRERIEKEKNEMRERLKIGQEEDEDADDSDEAEMKDDDEEDDPVVVNEDENEEEEANQMQVDENGSGTNGCCSHTHEADGDDKESETEEEEELQVLDNSEEDLKVENRRSPLDPSSDDIEDPIATDEREHNLASLNDPSSDELQDQDQLPASNWRSEFPNLQFNPNTDPDLLPTISIDLTKLSKNLISRRTRLEKEKKRKEALLLEKELQEKLTLEAENTSKAGFQNQDSEVVENVLNRIIQKEDFFKMKISGQFNLGFIIVRRRIRANLQNRKSGQDDVQDEVQNVEKVVGSGSGSGDQEKGEWIDDLFIVDQHAADEKWNFETLQRETKIRSQRMICSLTIDTTRLSSLLLFESPKTLELSATDALVAAEHLEALKDNGFELIIDDEAEMSKRVKLISLPVSKDVVFGVRDLEELIYHLRDVPSRSSKALSIRCSKARSMFASRACRKSVMIGKALNTRQMSNILKHMGSMDQPWNCPHGRPTMRHLVSLGTTNIGSSDSIRESAHRSIDWDALKD